MSRNNCAYCDSNYTPCPGHAENGTLRPTPNENSEALRARVIGTLTHYLGQCEREHVARTDQSELRELIAALAHRAPPQEDDK